MNVLFCSAGRRVELLKDFRTTMGSTGKIVATDISPYAPALYAADQRYIVPRIDDENYIDTLIEICKKEKIDAVFTLIDPEIAVLSQNRHLFESLGIKVMVPYYDSAVLCFDKLKMYKFLKKNSIPTITTFETIDEFVVALQNERVKFPVFVKPRTGSGSVGACKVDDFESLQSIVKNDPSLIIQEYIEGVDIDADVYIDAVSGKVVSAFTKKKISTTLGGANKTVSFKDEKLFAFIRKIVSTLDLYGPNDMDFFYKDGEYYLSEINPRFGGAYLHAYAAGVDFIKLIENNVEDIPNKEEFGNYEEDVVMMMYDSIVFKKKEEMIIQ